MPTDKKPPAGKAKPGGKTPSPASRKPAGGLNKKVGGLPVWAWGALVLGAVAVGLWFRSRGGSANTTAQPNTSGQDTSGTGDVGGGSGSSPTDGTTGVDIGPLEDAIAGLTDAIGSIPAAGGGDATNGGNGGNPITTQGTASGFWWGGKFFTSRAGWESWAKNHNINLSVWYAQHPQAARDIGVKPPPPPPSNGRTAVRAQPVQSKPQKAVVNTAHPPSSHPQAARVAAAATPKPKPAAKPKTARPAVARRP